MMTRVIDFYCPGDYSNQFSSMQYNHPQFSSMSSSHYNDWQRLSTQSLLSKHPAHSCLSAYICMLLCNPPPCV